MQKRNLFLGLILCTIGIGNTTAQGSFVLRGKALNLPEGKKTFQLATTHPYKNQLHTVQIRPDGTFEQSIPLATRLEDTYLYLGDAVTIMTYPGDTINLEFDPQQLPGSIRVWSNTPERNRELTLSMELYKQFRKRILNLYEAMYQHRSQQIGLDSLGSLAQRYIKDGQRVLTQFLATQGDVPHKDYFFQKIYFTGMSPLIHTPELLEQTGHAFDLYPGRENPINRPYKDPYFPFLDSPDAREFIQTYLNENIRKSTQIFNFTKEQRALVEYETGNALIPNKRLRDWFWVASDFAYLSFPSMTAAQAVADRLYPTLTDPEAKAFLKYQVENHVQPFLPGTPARNMTLTDLNGKEISLHSFKGKLVYMDIWGVGCDPCYQELKRTEKLHQAYEAHKDKIVYLYVCTQGSENEWKSILDLFRIKDKGIHLFVDDAHRTEANKYDRGVYPTYVLIDPEGKIIEYDTARPSELLHEPNNVLDRALQQASLTDGKQP